MAKKDYTYIGAYIIENSHIRRMLNFYKGKLHGVTVENISSGNVYPYGEDFEEFTITFKTGLLMKKTVSSRDLSLASFDKEGDICSFTFKDFRVADSKLRVRLVYSVPAKAHYIKKHLELSYVEKGSKDIILDCIEYERFNVDSKLFRWSVPDQKDSHIPGKALELGQPVYVGSLFFGVEFPVSYNKIEKGYTTLRTYSGRKLSDLLSDGTYKSYECVMGAAESDTHAVVQKAFFAYIKDISRPAKLRRQYNSWYDHMLNISAENLTESFYEVEKAMTHVGEPPLDSYVADDGWNDYTKGFWTFNSRFPNELYPLRDACGVFGSRFGLWLGPRGGYTSDTPKFAKQVEASGNGYCNRYSRDICVTSDKYVRKTSEFLHDCQSRFNLGYWKLDGFARVPCKNKKHDHLVGGFHDMYFYTDSWEKWLRVLSSLYDSGDDLWINLTCYAWPSPWFLMYCSSLWMQISDDHGFAGKKGEFSDKDRVLTYRDDRYYDFCRERQFQFPLSRLCNHEPIYAKEAKYTMTDDEFREFLFINAMRGTRFWELYYSHDLMNEEKWRINYSALRFAENNIDALYSPVIFGSKPTEGVYGYACFSPSCGLVAFRNPSKEPADYTLRLDERVGVATNFAGQATPVLSYKGKSLETGMLKYGDTFKVSLGPCQTQIYYFGLPYGFIESKGIRVVSENILEVTFTQMINPETIACLSNPIIEVKLLEDYMTARMTFSKPFDTYNDLALTNVRDIFGRSASVTLSFACYKDFIVTDGIYGESEFTIKATLDGEQAAELYTQGDDISLSIGSDGYVRFRAGMSCLKSGATVHDVVQVVAVRERNGVLKLYFNGKPDSGLAGVMTPVRPAKGIPYDANRVVVYSKALSYDEV